MKKYIIIKADTNDGDYVTEKTLISDEEVEKVKYILSKMDTTHKIRWETLDQANSKVWEQHPELTEEEAEFLYEFVPSGEYGVHTIESIEIIEVVNEIKLL